MQTGTFENINSIRDKIGAYLKTKTGSSPNWVKKFKAAVKKCKNLFAANCPIGVAQNVVSGSTETSILRVDTQDLNQQGASMNTSTGASCGFPAGLAIQS